MKKETELLYGRQEEIDKSGNTKITYPQTKREALDAKEIGANVKIEKRLGLNIISYFQSIGADKDLPTGKQELVGFINRFHMQVAIKNPLWPENLPFGYVYASFLNAVIYDHTELHGFNIKAHIKAFKSWITQNGIKDRLFEKYYANNPDAQPKQITKKSESEFVNEEKLLDQSPEDVKRQVEILATIHGTFENAIDSIADNGNSYRHKLQRTYDHYKQKKYYD